MSPTKKFFSGNTLEQAVLQAARFFHIEPDMVAYEPVERRHGFLKVRRRVVIGVDPENPERDIAVDAETRADAGKEARAAEPESFPSLEPESDRAEGRREASGEETRIEPEDRPADGEDRPPARREQDRQDAEAREDIWKSLSPADAKEAAEEALRRLFRLGDLSLTAKVSAGSEGLEVEIRGDDEAQLFDDRGRLLLAIQHLLPRMVRGLTGSSIPARVDSDNFHEVRAEQLRMLAQDAAAEVRREGKMQTLEPMSPDERRIVHMTLAEDPAVDTESHGTGLFKRVAVRPVRAARDRDRYSR